jgi:tetratricopeptide (TPR) repeat protein
MSIRSKFLPWTIVAWIAGSTGAYLAGQAPPVGADDSRPSRQERPTKSLEVEPAVPESLPDAEEPGSKPGSTGGLFNALKGVLGADTLLGKPSDSEEPLPGTEGAGDQLVVDASDEIQKKINELMSGAHRNMEKGRVSEAMKDVNELIALKPYEADFHFALGLCYRKEGKYAEALKKYQDVLDLGGPRAMIALFRAEAHAGEGNTVKAFEHLKEAAVGGRNIINDVRLFTLLSGYQSDTEFIKLALQLEKVTVAVGRSHDPFTNPFPKAVSEVFGKLGTKGDGRGVGEVLTPEDQERLLQDAKKTFERVQFYIKLEDETKAMKAYTSLREMIRKKDVLKVPKLVNEFRILVSRLEELEIEIEGIRLKYYYNQAQAKLKQIKELFNDGEYQRVESIHLEIAKLAQEMEQANVRYKPVSEQVLGASTRWINRARVRHEFESRKPTIQGVIISEDSKMAVLNNKVIKQGDSLDDFRVIKVESNRVTFRYKGEEIPLVFRRY